MPKPSISKIGMIASITTGFLLAFAHLLEEAVQNDTWIIVAKNLILIAHLAMVFSLVAIYESDSSKNGWRAAGMLLATVGTMLVSAIVFVEAASVSMPEAIDGSRICLSGCEYGKSPPMKEGFCLVAKYCHHFTTIWTRVPSG